MVTVIGTGLSETIQTGRRNLFVEPDPANAGNWSSFNVTRSFVDDPVDGKYGHGVTSTVSSTYWTHAIARRVPVSPGDSVTIQADVRGTITASHIRLFFYNAAGAQLSLVSGAGITPSSDWQRPFVTAVAPAGAASVGFWVLGGTADPVGSTFDIRRVQVEKSAEADGYFAGSTPAASPYSYTWAGTANASQSIEWVTLPIQVRPQLVDGFEASREIRNIVHPVLNKSNPDVTLRAPGLRSGEFRCLFATQADALAAFARLSVPQVFTITDPDASAIDMSFVVGTVGGSGELSIELDDETRTVWWVVVPFVEVIV